MGEYESKNKVNPKRVPDTGNYAGKHAKPGCFSMILACVILVVFLIFM